MPTRNTKRGATANDGATANAALRILHQWREQRQTQAARVIQKHWRQSLVKVHSGKKVHRSRIVPHNGRVYNARAIDVSLNHWFEDPNHPNHWPGTKNAMNFYDKLLVLHRGSPWRRDDRADERKMDEFVRKLEAATSASKKGNFEPFRRAGWRFTTFTFEKNGMTKRTMRIPVQRRWSERTTASVLRRLTKLPVYELRDYGTDRVTAIVW